jgi:hypothetical protein
MFDQIRMIQSLACDNKYSAGAEYANVFCTTGRNNTVYDVSNKLDAYSINCSFLQLLNWFFFSVQTEWPSFSGSYSTVYTSDTGVNGSASFDVNTTTAPSLFPSIHG